MLVRELRSRPQLWSDYRHSIPRWAAPLHILEWLLQWFAYALSRWAFLEVLEYLGTLSVLFGVIFYYSEAGDRAKQRHYQAWQVINTAQGRGGSGGRIEALQELNADRIPLTGVDVSGAFLMGVRLPNARLARAAFHAVDARGAVLDRASLDFADLTSANFRNASLSHATLAHADLSGADLTSADLSNANLDSTNLDDADLTSANLSGASWRSILSIRSANVYSLRNPPTGFLPWALAHGAVSTPPDSQ